MNNELLTWYATLKSCSEARQMEEKLNWGDLFQGKLKEEGFSIDDVHTIYRLTNKGLFIL